MKASEVSAISSADKRLEEALNSIKEYFKTENTKDLVQGVDHIRNSSQILRSLLYVDNIEVKDGNTQKTE